MGPEPHALPFPRDPADFRSEAEAFAARLRELKKTVSPPDYGWYPYETLTNLPAIAGLMAPHLDEIAPAVDRHGAADIGCGDGDLAMLLARLGAAVDAIDHAESNFNQMRGVDTLRRVLPFDVRRHDTDLDTAFTLPRSDYGLALFLGTLYHLKNPFYALERIAGSADWCVMSTRIAQVTPRGAAIEHEPVAYLLGAREANNDPTNFWIFSFAGLLRLVERAGWIVMGHQRAGCGAASDPVRAEADERAFLLLKSRLRHPELHVRPLDGWYPPESDVFRWTAKRFGLEVTLAAPAREFALRLWAPEAALSSGTVRISCAVSGEPAGALTCPDSSIVEFRGRFPAEATVHRLDFTVESAFAAPGDQRDLGICVPMLDPSRRATQRIPFRVS